MSSALWLLALCLWSVVDQGASVGMYAPAHGVYLGITPSTLLNSPLDSEFAVLLQFYEFAELLSKDSFRKDLTTFISKCDKWDVLPVISLTTFDGLDSYTVADIEWFSNTLNSYNISIILRWNHEMNGNWFPWGQHPIEYVQKFQQWANITRQLAPKVAMMWSPDDGNGYPFGVGTYTPTQGSADYEALDTNGDGVLDSYDDPYGPYFPGEYYVEWVGYTGYFWGGAFVKPGVWKLGLNIVPTTHFFQNDIISSLVTWTSKHIPDFPIMMCETAALYTTNLTLTTQYGLTPASEYDIKTKYIDQLYNTTSITASYPMLKGIVWFEHDKIESAVSTEVYWSLSHNDAVWKYFEQTVYSNPFYVTSFSQPQFHHLFPYSNVFYGILVAFFVSLAVIVASPCLSPVITKINAWTAKSVDAEAGSDTDSRSPAWSDDDLKKAFLNFLRGSDWISYGAVARVMHVLFLVFAYVLLAYSLFLRFSFPGGLPSRVSYAVTVVEIGLGILMLLYNILLMPDSSYYKLLKVEPQHESNSKEDEEAKSPELIFTSKKPSVDILIVCYQEEESTIALTLKKCSELIKPKRIDQINVFLLDDQGVDSRIELCSRYNATYMSRVSKDPSQKQLHGKAGNLNFGLSRSWSDFVLILDADMAPEKLCLVMLYRALTRAGASTAFAQAPHRFYDLTAGDVFYSRSVLFNLKTLQFFGSFGYCPFVGSNALFRRSALDAVGGIDTDSITEDIVTSFKMHEKGMKSIFVPIPLCHGTSPQTGPQMYTQRHRWAIGGLEFAHEYCRRLFRLNRTCRLLYLYIIFNTIVGPLVFTLLFGALITALALGLHIYSDFVGKFTLLYILAFRISWMSGLVARNRRLTLELWSEEIVGPYYLVPVTVMMWFVNGSFMLSKLGLNKSVRVFKSTVAQKTVRLEHAIFIKSVGVVAVGLLFSGLTGLARYYFRDQYSEFLISVICVTAGLRTLLSCMWYTVPHTVIKYPTIDASFDCLKTLRFKLMCILPIVDLLGAIGVASYIWRDG